MAFTVGAADAHISSPQRQLWESNPKIKTDPAKAGDIISGAAILCRSSEDPIYFGPLFPQLALWATNIATRWRGFSPVGEADAHISSPQRQLWVHDPYVDGCSIG